MCLWPRSIAAKKKRKEKKNSLTAVFTQQQFQSESPLTAHWLQKGMYHCGRFLGFPGFPYVRDEIAQQAGIILTCGDASSHSRSEWKRLFGRTLVGTRPLCCHSTCPVKGRNNKLITVKIAASVWWEIGLLTSCIWTWSPARHLNLNPPLPPPCFSCRCGRWLDNIAPATASISSPSYTHQIFGNTYFDTPSLGHHSLCVPSAMSLAAFLTICLSLSLSLSQMTCCAKCKWFSWLTSSVGCQPPPFSLRHAHSSAELEYGTRQWKRLMKRRE